MTDTFVKSPTCECEFDAHDGKLKLALVEGNTTIWSCPHVDVYFKQRKTSWVLHT